jgi:hypothetical protein
LTIAAQRAVRVRIAGVSMLHLPQMGHNAELSLPALPPAGGPSGAPPQLYISTIWR